MGIRLAAMASSKKNSAKGCRARVNDAQLQELHRSSRPREWQHLERCLDQAPGALELLSSTTIGVPGAGKNGEEAALVRVAYQGNAGAYSHAVVGEAFGGAAEAIPCREFEAVFCAVESWLADRALLPIQNSLDGTIHRNYDLLLRHRLHIVGELPWQVQHCLLARPGASKAQLRRVIAHPQALSHCQHTLATLGFPAESFQPVEDTTSAALQLASSSTSCDDTAVIASSKAAHVFGLQILAHGIQDDAQNITRFLQLARDPLPCTPSLPCKTTVAFALRNGPNDLCKAMAAFALRDIRVTNLESRPAPAAAAPQQQPADAAEQFKYIFVVDIEASTASALTQRALKQVEEISSFYRVLGSYAVHQL